MSSNINDDYNDIDQIEAVEFSLLGNNEVKSMSVINDPNEEVNGIIYAETYEDREPKIGGIIDRRLGTTDSTRLCLTCNKDVHNCPGHWGHTRFELPVINFPMRDYIKSVLGMVCLNCKKLLLYKTNEELEEILKYKKGKARFDEIKKLTSSITYCQNVDQGCNTPVRKIKIEIKSGIMKYVAESLVPDEEDILEKKKKSKLILTPALIYDIFTKISEQDCKIMGFNPALCLPQDMIIINFPIPPVAIRPSVRADYLFNGSSEDTLNNKLADIIRSTIKIRKFKDKNHLTDDQLKYKELLIDSHQFMVSTYHDNESVLPATVLKTSGRPTKSVAERMKGKHGRIRGNCMGKRTNFSARTVITSNPNISLDELGVPLSIAMNVPFREVVGPLNIKKLQNAVRNGRKVYPGANSVLIKNDNGTYRRIDLRPGKTPNIKFGDIVERHLVDGDLVLFNRQPTLHKYSTMTHRVKVLTGYTYRLNVSVTKPYNADKLLH